MVANYILADASDAVALFKILFFVVFIAAWIGVRARVKAKVNKLTNPVNKAESILQSACKDMERKGSGLRSVRFLCMVLLVFGFRAGSARFPVRLHPGVPLHIRAL